MVTRNGEGEVVTGIVLKLIGQNTSDVIDNVKEKIARLGIYAPIVCPTDPQLLTITHETSYACTGDASGSASDQSSQSRERATIL